MTVPSKSCLHHHEAQRWPRWHRIAVLVLPRIQIRGNRRIPRTHHPRVAKDYPCTTRELAAHQTNRLSRAPVREPQRDRVRISSNHEFVLRLLQDLQPRSISSFPRDGESGKRYSERSRHSRHNARSQHRDKGTFWQPGVQINRCT